MRHAKKLGALLLAALLCLMGGSAMAETSNPSDIFTRWEVRDGTSETTLPTPDDFPVAYDLSLIHICAQRHAGVFKRIRAVVAVLRADGKINGRARFGKRLQVAVPLGTGCLLYTSRCV